MQFLLLAHDATDAEAPARRQTARQAHLDMIDRYKARGHMILGAALLNEAGAMNGSAIVADFPDRAALDAWLAEEPYLLQKVWGKVTVTPCKLAPAFQSLLPGA